MVFVWIALIAALVVTLVLCGIMLARKLIGLLRAFADLISLPAILDGVHRADPEVRPNAIADGAGAAKERRARLSAARSSRRDARSGRRLDHGRALVRADLAPFAARLSGLDLAGRRAGGTIAKDNHHVE